MNNVTALQYRYQKAWRDYVKFRHLLANMSKPTFEDKRKLEAKEIKLQEMRTQSKMKRDVTVAVSAEGFYRTGIMCDIIQVSEFFFLHNIGQSSSIILFH